MWLRRLGVPQLWPSRIKVIIQAIFSVAFIRTFCSSLRQSGVDWLDLRRPVHSEIVCKLPLPECRGEADPIDCMWEKGPMLKSLNLNTSCPEVPEKMASKTCYNVSIPIEIIGTELRTVNGLLHPLRLWSSWFYAILLVLVLFVLIHDLALLSPAHRPNISSFSSLAVRVPCLQHFLQKVMCFNIMKDMTTHQLVLFLLVWVPLQLVLFTLVLYPATLFASLYAPVAMSRIMVFGTGMLCLVWSIIFIAVTSAFDSHRYAVMENTRDPGEHGCICICEFHMKSSMYHALVLAAGLVGFQSFSFSFRALKGLRRRSWANLFSVMYTVPVQAFPVMWNRPKESGGGPIAFRSEGEPVQGEPAFDPFCLMDEQPESGRLRPCIAPVAETEAAWTADGLNVANADIGCCGFPRGQTSGEISASSSDNGELDETESYSSHESSMALRP